MPFKIFPKLPESIDPAEASVLDPLHTQLIRRAVGALGIGDPESEVMGAAAPAAIAIGPIKKAPRRAMMEFVKMLEGKSSRVPPFRQLTPEQASTSALLNSRIGGLPPRGTQMRLRDNIPLKLSGRKKILRDPVVDKAYKDRQAFFGRPVRSADAYIPTESYGVTRKTPLKSTPTPSPISALIQHGARTPEEEQRLIIFAKEMLRQLGMPGASPQTVADMFGVSPTDVLALTGQK